MMKNGLLIIVTCGGPLLTRLYYTKGGSRIWFMSFLATAGCPIILIPLYVSFLRLSNRSHNNSETTEKAKVFVMETPLFIAYPSLSAFNAIFSFLMVKQKFTPFSINAVVLLTVGTGILALHTNGDRPAGVSKKEYVVGFMLTLIAAVLYAFLMPLVELTYKKVRQEITFTLVLEMQMVMCVASTCFCLVGMVVKGDFKAIPREAREFMIGSSLFYYTLIVVIGIVWQCFFLGAFGVVYCASSLTSGVFVSVLLPVTEVLAVVCFREKFQAKKGVALLLSLWGFVSYFSGEFKSGKKIIDSPKSPETELPPLPVSGSDVA
ncbi:BnaC03g58420D [Brassica napus]|uniref:Probable purine permease n=1 Tax=Brassica napus TaxID=3708 RepID=A0A078HDD1_BRANA|nr:unnamed protein product [Brassica napus]CDY35721.1 BnaC03g58420D [Brassica napus]